MAAVAHFWQRPPSSYFPTLNSLQAFWLDEAAAMWLLSEQEKQCKYGNKRVEWVGEAVL